MKTSELIHVARPLPGGGEVIILNTGAIIGPEAEAMLQALHSRSVGGLREHLKTLGKRGAEKFMSMFYVGYGHKSIGDCGTITIFIEGVSMLAAKAVQDSQLYSGQEASTRFIDFAQQRFINPWGTASSRLILEELREFYVVGLEKVTEDVARRFPRKSDEDENVYEKAVRARAFDIMRGFLPAGASTNLTWHTNFRQTADALMYLRHHPLDEVRVLAQTIEETLNEAYPNSFNHKRHPQTEDYNKEWMKSGYYNTNPTCEDFVLAHDGVDRSLLREFTGFLRTRPPKTEIPKKVGLCGTMRFEFTLDFGSFRDLQRHRAVIQRMPLVTTQYGFHPWYLSELPEILRSQAQRLLRHECHSAKSQYYVPMGYQLPMMVTGDIPALVYLVELRATRFVHPTLRARARQMAAKLQDKFGDFGLTIHLDPDPDRFDVRRGEHDISLKSQ